MHLNFVCEYCQITVLVDETIMFFINNFVILNRLNIVLHKTSGYKA